MKEFLNVSSAYLRVPAMNVTWQEAMDEKANLLRDLLCMLLSKNPRGIVLDLRMNSGTVPYPCHQDWDHYFKSLYSDLVLTGMVRCCRQFD